MIKRWETKSKWNFTLCSLLSFNEQFSSLLEKSFLLLINYDIQNYDLRLGLLIFWLVDEIQCGIFSSNKFQAINLKQWISTNEFQAVNFKQWIASNAFQEMNFKQCISSNKFQALNFKQWISRNEFQAVNFKQCTSSNEFKAMNFKQWISSNAFQAMHFKQRISMNFKQWISSNEFQAMKNKGFKTSTGSITPQVMLPVGVLPGKNPDW